LRHAELHGVTTNRDLLVGILGEEEFLAGRTDTGYLTRHDNLGATEGDGARQAAAAALARQARHRRDTRVLPAMPSGWRNVGGTPQRIAYTHGAETLEVAYSLRRSGLRLTVNGEPLGESVRLVSASADAVELEIDGVHRSYTIHTVADVSYVDDSDGSAALTEVPRFADPDAAAAAGSLLAAMPGSVVRVLVGSGDTVVAGQVLIVLEAMKMEHTVVAPVDGVVAELLVRQGDQVDTGQVLAVVEGVA
jgi:acetyl/propionyl-CoA carboxylase alpha subunit